LWVGPGSENKRLTYSTAELIEKGKLGAMFLWKRSWTEDVQGWRML